ncbi:MAG: cytosolic protein [Deltaproteobacteria bacterium]|nr:cytosolic protein [Deltaproteobacteria bacterium]
MPHNEFKKELNGFDQDQLITFLLDVFRRTIVHYGLWFREVEHQMGFKGAVEAEAAVWPTLLPILMKRLAKTLGFEVDDQGRPLWLKQLDRQELMKLIEASAINWLASDGVWFQAVEKQHDMNNAKRCNDTCWTRYSPYEAERAKALLGLPDNSGLEGLKAALGLRAYAMINQQSIHEVDDKSFIFQMNDCRVQAARQRRGLDDYPCKSVGLVEYPFFAKTIDSRIQTECLGCPPDEHPKEWFCAWKFNLVD